MKITRALSIRQPFAEEIMAGRKTIEYRTIRTNIRERVYIYASKHDYARTLYELPRGVIVGSVEISDCVGQLDVPGHQELGISEYRWILKNPKRLKRLLKPKGKPQPVWFKPF